MIAIRKDIHTLLVLVASLLLSLPLAAKEEGPDLAFNTLDHDFGTFAEEEGNVTYEFTMTNVGTAVAIVQKVGISCGCTTPSYTRSPIAPGKTGTLAVRYDATGRPGKFHKLLFVYSNSIGGMVTLSVRGEVIPAKQQYNTLFPIELKHGVRTNRKAIEIALMNNKDVIYEKVGFYNGSPSVIEISAKPSQKGIVCSRYTTPIRIAPKEYANIELAIDGAQAKSFGRITDKIEIKLDNGGNGQTFTLPMTANVVEKFPKLSAAQWGVIPIAHFSGVRIDFGRINRSAQQTLRLTNKGKQELIIRDINCSNKAFKISSAASSIKAGESIEYTITAKAQGLFKGIATGDIVFITNDPSSPMRTIKLKATF